MALTILHTSAVAPQSGITIRPGDVVFQYEAQEVRYPLHTGIYVGAEQAIDSPNPRLRVCGLPGHRDYSDRFLDESVWGDAGEFKADLIGQRKDVDPVIVKEVVHISRLQLAERPQIFSRCEWKNPKQVRVDLTRSVGDVLGVFIQGSCAQFVEFVYEQAYLPLLATNPQAAGPWPQKFTFDPENPRRIYPATQIHVFYAGEYGLREPWDARYADYPACIFGERSTV
jgi:hypothetical protein